MIIDKVHRDPDPITGREQMLVDFHGGAQSVGGTSANALNPIDDLSEDRPYFIGRSIIEFGPLPDNSPARRRYGDP
jgi:hypothetical protein